MCIRDSVYTFDTVPFFLVLFDCFVQFSTLLITNRMMGFFLLGQVFMYTLEISLGDYRHCYPCTSALCSMPSWNSFRSLNDMKNMNHLCIVECVLTFSEWCCFTRHVNAMVDCCSCFMRNWPTTSQRHEFKSCCTLTHWSCSYLCIAGQEVYIIKDPSMMCEVRVVDSACWRYVFISPAYSPCCYIVLLSRITQIKTWVNTLLVH